MTDDFPPKTLVIQLQNDGIFNISGFDLTGTVLTLLGTVRSDIQSSEICLRFNNDTRMTYSWQSVLANTSSERSNYINCGPCSCTTNSSFSAHIIQYANSDKNKEITFQSILDEDDNDIYDGFWYNKEPITSIQLFLTNGNKFVYGSTITLQII